MKVNKQRKTEMIYSKICSIKTERDAKDKQKGNLLWVWRAACTKQGWSVSFSSSCVNAMRPACSIKLRLSATWAANASPRFCRAASRAWVSEAWRSARAAVRSLMLWASCSLADTLFTWWRITQGKKRVFEHLETPLCQVDLHGPLSKLTNNIQSAQSRHKQFQIMKTTSDSGHITALHSWH